MVQMRHINVLLLLLSLSLQWVWANSGACRTEAHAPATYAALSAMLHMGNPLPQAIPDQTPSLAPWALEVASSQSIFVENSPIQSEISSWEFDENDKSGIVAQIYTPDWGDVTVDDLSCRMPPPTDNTDSVVQSPDLYEVDHVLPVYLACLVPGDPLFVAAQHPPLPAPVFGPYRPPSLTA